jgi:hypothetical protein
MTKYRNGTSVHLLWQVLISLTWNFVSFINECTISVTFPFIFATSINVTSAFSPHHLKIFIFKLKKKWKMRVSLAQWNRKAYGQPMTTLREVVNRALALFFTSPSGQQMDISFDEVTVLSNEEQVTNCLQKPDSGIMSNPSRRYMEQLNLVDDVDSEMEDGMQNLFEIDILPLIVETHIAKL